MEQILVSQLSSLTQTSFQLTLRGNSQKISQFRRELSEYLTSNSVTVDIAEKEDNLLTGDKVQVVSETTYSNYSRTVENIFTGSFNPIIFDYVLNHCKQKTLMGCNNSLPEGIFRFKIEPLIRIQSILSKNKASNRVSKLSRQEQSEQMMAVTQRNSNKSNRHVKSSRKNEEDYSKQSVNHEYHGRKCYCCSNRSDQGSQLLDQFSIFTRMPKKSFGNNKQNSGKKPLRVSEFQSIRKSPQSLAHQLSMRGSSSQSERNSKSSNLYYRKHLQTLVDKKEGENSNRCSRIVGEGDNKVEKSDTINRSQSNKWIKTTRNEKNIGKICQIDDQKNAQLKKTSKLSIKIARNNNKVFQKTLQNKVFQNKAEFSDEQSIKDHSSDCKKVSKHQTANNTVGYTKIQYEQRYSQMIAPNSPKIEIMGGYSVDRNINRSSNICPGLQKMAHQRNQQTESLCKDKKQIDPIAKIKRKNEARIRNNEDTPIILNRSNQKIVSANKTFHERGSVINIGRSPLNKSIQNNASTHRLSANRIKKLPLTQKMHMIKQGQEKTKANKRQESLQPREMHQKDQIKDDIQQNERTKMHQKEETITQNHNSNHKSSNSLKKMQQSRKKLVKSPNNSISKAVSGQKKVSTNVKSRQVIQRQQKEHEDDNFSVTQQRINSYQQHQQMNTPIHNKETSSDPKPENDLACTIKQIAYEDEQFKNKQMRQSHPMSIEGDNSSRIQTSRTIPLRNQTNETVKSAKQELQVYKNNNDLQGEKEQFNDFLDKSQKPQNSQRSSADILSNNRFNTCESHQIIQSKVINHQNIEFNNKIPHITTESDFLNDSLINADQKFSGSNNNQKHASEYSSTKRLQIKQEYEPPSKNRLSIDEQLHSARSAREFNQNRVSENATQDNVKIQSDRNVLSGNLQQFEKEIFAQPAKSESKDQNQPIENVKINKVGRKDLLRLQTINEVNQSIYRQNQKKQMEQRLNSLSVSGNVSNSKLKNNVLIASSNMVSETAINSMSNKLQNQQNTQRKNEVKISQESKEQYECESKQIICSQKQVQQHNYQPIYTPDQTNQQQISAVSNEKYLEQPRQQAQKLLQISNDKDQIYQNLIKKSKCDIEKKNFNSDVHKNEGKCNVVLAVPQNTQLHERNTASIQNLYNKVQANHKQEVQKPFKSQEISIQSKFDVSPTQEQPQIYMKTVQINQDQLKEASYQNLVQQRPLKQTKEKQQLFEQKLSKQNGSKVDRFKASIPEEQQQKIIENIQSNKDQYQVKKQTVENRQKKQVANEETAEFNKKEQIMNKQQQSQQSPQQNLNKQTIAPTSLIMPNITDNSKIHSNTITKEKFESTKVSSVALQPNKQNINERSSMKKITMTVPQKDIFPQILDKKQTIFQNKINNMASKFHQQNILQHYPSKSSNTLHVAPRQQKSIQVQTDYLLPNQQPSPTQKSLISKSQSDHLSKKKCKINLCEPQIISTFNNFTSSHQITTKQLKKKKRQSALNRINYEKDIKRSQKDALIVSNIQQESQHLKSKAVLATQPSNQINELRTDHNHETGIQSVFSNMSDLTNNKETKILINERLNVQQQQKREYFNLKLDFRPSQSVLQTITHPQIINKLVYKNIPIVRADVTERQYSEKKGEIVVNAIAFIQRTLPNFIDLITNKQKNEICLFVNNQWMLFRDSCPISLTSLLRSQLREQSIYKCVEMMTGMPMRILKDKSQQNSKRLIKSLKTMLEKRQEESSFQRILYGLSKVSQQVVRLQKVRYFLDSSKQSKSILECRKAAARKGQQLCNFEGDTVNEFIQLFLISNPKYLTLEVDPASVNTYEIELAQLVFYISGNYKFILYEQTAKNEYRLIKESHLWLKHKNQRQLTKFLLILEPIPKKQGPHVITLRLATAQGEQGSRTNRVVKYQNGGRAKGYQGGYQNQKNLYLPISKQITQCPLD